MKVNEQATSKENTVGHDTNICYFLLHMLLLRLVITLCGGPGFYPFEIHVFSILHNVLSFKAMFLVI